MRRDRTGDTTFGAPDTFPGPPGHAIARVALADFDGDGVLDVIGADAASARPLTLWRGQPDGSLGAAESAGGSVRAGALPSFPLADVDADGAVDIVIADAAAGASVLLNTLPITKATLSFAPQVLAADDPNVNADTGVTALACADLDRDGVLDLVSANGDAGSQDNLSMWLGAADGTFATTPVTLGTTGQQTTGVALADVDDDGDIDIVAADTAADFISLRRNNGAAVFGGASFFGYGGPGAPGGPLAVVVGDVTDDGLLDFVDAAGADNVIGLLTADGAGNFASTSFATGFGPAALVLVDVDRNGDVDVVNVNAGGSVGVALRDPAGAGFLASEDFPAGISGTEGIAAGDVDGDGIVDVVVVGGGVRLLRGDGGSGFGAPTIVDNTVSEAPAVALADFDRDGRLDVAYANFTGDSVVVRRGLGSGNFGAPVTRVVGSRPRALVVGDFNRDGLVDIAVHNSVSGRVGVLLNDSQ